MPYILNETQHLILTSSEIQAIQNFWYGEPMDMEYVYVADISSELIINFVSADGKPLFSLNTKTLHIFNYES